MSRTGFLGVAVVAICLGLALRLGPWHLPLTVHHYGGGVLWGAMVVSLVVFARPRSWGWAASVTAACACAAAVELPRLYHAPVLDAFRKTMPGQLLLGSIFSTWNLVAYAVGIIAIVAVCWRSDV